MPVGLAMWITGMTAVIIGYLYQGKREQLSLTLRFVGDMLMATAVFPIFIQPGRLTRGPIFLFFAVIAYMMARDIVRFAKNISAERKKQK